MNNCEDFLMALMARLDGEEAEFSVEQAESHLAACDNCRAEFAQMQSADVLLKRQARRAYEAELWSAVEKQIEAEPTNWQPFLVLGAFLLAYKVIEILPASDFGFLVKIIPVVVVAALFVFLRENPFKINTELILEK